MRGRSRFRARSLLLVALLLGPVRAEASWTVTEIAVQADQSRHEGDWIAYRTADDLALYEISTGRQFPITRDGSASLEEMLGTQENWLWFSSLDAVSGSRWLKLYDRGTGRILDLMESANFMVWGGADGGVALVRANQDWWLCGAGILQQVTQSGSSVGKHEGIRSGDFIVWIGASAATGTYRKVFRTQIATGLTLVITPADRDHHSLCGDGDHVAWVEYPGSLSTLQKIFYYRASTGERRLVGTSEDSWWGDILDLKHPWLVWTRKEGARWKLMRYHVDTGANTVLTTSDLRMLEPVFLGTRVLYVTHNCPSGTCEEPNAYDLARWTRSRLTTCGYTHKVGPLEGSAERIVWSDFSSLTGSRVLMALDVP